MRSQQADKEPSSVQTVGKGGKKKSSQGVHRLIPSLNQAPAQILLLETPVEADHKYTALLVVEMTI